MLLFFIICCLSWCLRFLNCDLNWNYVARHKLLYVSALIFQYIKAMLRAIAPPCGCISNSPTNISESFYLWCRLPSSNLLTIPPLPIFQKLRAFFQNVSMDRYGEPFTIEANTMVWSFAVAIFSVGGMVGSFSVGTMVNTFGR